MYQTCSQYMLDALKIHGPFTGLIMGTGRILRCRPGGTHGYDPVPLLTFPSLPAIYQLFTKMGKRKSAKKIRLHMTVKTARPQDN